jgi:tripartite-type tricarboxylate transporter receptor subunit TctC
MNFARRQTLEFVATIAIAPFLSRFGWAQTYPARPVRVIVPYAPGGITDAFARLIAQRLSEDLGKQFYVDNIPGGSGNIGTGQAARSTPDGYTILVVFSSYVVNPTLFDKIPYDPNKDFDRNPSCDLNYRARGQSFGAGEDGQRSRCSHQSQSR